MSWRPRARPRPLTLSGRIPDRFKSVLVDINMHDSATTVVLNRFRPHMHILVVTKGSTICRTGALGLDDALAKARELFQDDGVRVAGAF